MNKPTQKSRRLMVFFYGLISLSPLMSHAEQGHHHEVVAHSHGVANLNWILDGTELHIALESPMMNLLGFEHKPHNDDEQQLLETMLTSLNDTKKVVDLMGGQCELINANIINPFQESEHHKPQDSAVSHEAEHAEMKAEYAFLCQQPSQLEAININLFDTFSGFKVINAQWIMDGKQGGAGLNHDHHLVKVR